MIKKARFRAKAEIEFYDYLAWYTEVSIDLGDKFYREIDEAIEIISVNPKIGTQYKNEIRKYVLNDFPYILFYVEEEHEIIILAIFHGLRDPKSISQALK